MSGTDGAPDGAAERRRLVQPLGGLLVFAGAIIMFFAAFGVAGTISGSGMQLAYPGLDIGPVCVDVNLNGVSIAGNGTSLTGLRPGASVGVPNPVPVCLQHATAEQRALAFLASAPHTLYYLVIFAVVAWMLLVARREGPFTSQVHRLLRFLGWFVIIGSVIAGIACNLAAAQFLASVTTAPVPVVTDAWSGALLGVPLLAGCALLTLARIIRAGSGMREDLEGTV